MHDLVTQIEGRLSELNSEIDKLVEAKLALMGAEPTKPVEVVEPIKLVQPTKPTKKTKSTKTSKREVSRSSAARTKRLDAAKARKAKADTESRSAAIMRLTREGMSPKEIAAELDANISYVYLVRRAA